MTPFMTPVSNKKWINKYILIMFPASLLLQTLFKQFSNINWKDVHPDQLTYDIVWLQMSQS